ncbi:MAG: BREX system Lon protease-like protein BrxL [Promicromonosporaceae bacterium]|nr:BREX system Lon protease-like protein BrxL [Promicromonosporaceae bacterium]
MTEALQLDEVDEIATSAFDGYVVRKDLAQQFKGTYPVPTYVGEFLIGRFGTARLRVLTAEIVKWRASFLGRHCDFKNRAARLVTWPVGTPSTGVEARKDVSPWLWSLWQTRKAQGAPKGTPTG